MDLKWWGSLCLAFMLALPMGMAQADDDDDDDRWEERDEDDKKKNKKDRKDRDDDDDDDEEEGEIELDSVRYQSKKNLIRIKGELDDFDGRTEVVVSESAFGTELASKRVKEEFNFKIELATGQPVPCTVVVSAGDTSVTAPVRKAPDTCDKFITTISGVVTDGASSLVSVTLDGDTFSTVADEQGAYTLEVATGSVGDLVKIEASSDTIEYVNLAGSFERLLGDEPQNVNNLTSASFVLAVRANGGSEPTTLEELQAAETATDATELLQLAAVIKLLVDDPNFTLPAGFDSVLDFAVDSTAVAGFVADNPEAVEQAVAEILEDGDLLEGFTDADIPDRYFSIPTANPGFLARQGEILEFDLANKTGTFLSFNAPAGAPVNGSFSYTIDGGRLVLDFSDPVVFTSFPALENTTATQEQIDLLASEFIFQVQEDRSVTRITYTRATTGSLVDVVAVEEVSDVTYQPEIVPNPNPDNDPSTDDEFIEVQLAPVLDVVNNNNDTLRASDNIQTIPLVADCAAATVDEVCVPGRWGGVYRYSAGEQFGFVFPTTSYGEVITFSASGTTLGAISGAGASWEVIDGSLVISYPDGAVQKVTLLDNIGIEYGALSEYTPPPGESRFASYNIWVKADAGFEFTENLLETAPGKYWQGDINTWIPGNLDENGDRNIDITFGWTFDPQADPDPNQGENLLYGFFDNNGDGEPENVLLRRPNTWELQPGRLRIQRFLGGSDFVRNRVRFWYPIASIINNGERVLYVMELEVFDDGSPDGQLLIPQRINIETELDIPPEFESELFINLP